MVIGVQERKTSLWLDVCVRDVCVCKQSPTRISEASNGYMLWTLCRYMGADIFKKMPTAASNFTICIVHFEGCVD